MMFPLRHPLRTPQLVEKPAAQPDAAQLELSDEYIAEILLREARQSAKIAEKYGVMSYLAGSRVAPQRKEKPDALFFQNVMKSTVGSSEFQERKQQLRRMQQDEVDYYRRKHLSQTDSRDRHDRDRDEKKEKKSKKDKDKKRSKKEKKDKHHKHSHSNSGSVEPAKAPAKPPSSTFRPAVRGRGVRAFNPSEPDAARTDTMYESLPVQREDPPEVLAKHRSLLSSSDSSSDSRSPCSRSRSTPPRRSRSPSPYGPRPRTEEARRRHHSKDRRDRF